MTNLVQFPGLGLSFELDRVAFSIGGMNIYWYGVCIAVGMCLALVFAFRHSVEFGVDADAMVDVILIGVVMGILCARLYYVALSPYQYHSLKDVLAIRDGGLAIYGGIIGSLLAGFLVAKIRKVKFLPLLDIVGIGFLLGQGIGRWGNFFNQEAFGCNTNSIFGMSGGRIQEWITDQYPSTTYFANFGTALDASQPVHPCFLYESVWCLLGFVLLALFAKKIRRYDGQIFLIYICWYGAERAVVEGLRTDSLVIGNVRVSQILAICCVVVSVILQIAIGTKVKRMGVDYHMYKDTAESKRMLAEYEAGKTGADTAEDSESNETESTDDTTDTTTEADASDASADNDDTATENCENENEKE